MALSACGPTVQRNAVSAREGRKPPATTGVAERAYRPPPLVLGAALAAQDRTQITGRTDPNSRVRLAAPAGVAVYARPAPDGAWRISLPPSAQMRLFGLSMIEGGRAVPAEGYIALTPEGEAAQLRSGAGAVVLAPPAAFRILAVDFDRKGGAVVSGTASPGGAVEASVDGAPAGEVAADSQGRYALPLSRPLGSGRRLLHIAAGNLASAVEIEMTPPQTPAGSPFRAQRTPAGWRIDWITPGGGVQSTVLVAPSSITRPSAG